MSVLQKEYAKLKTQYPEHLVWFRVGDYIESINECAVKTSKTIGTVLTKNEDTPITGFDYNMLDTNLQKAVKAGFKVALVEYTVSKHELKEQWDYTHDYSRLKVGMTVHYITGSEIVIDEIKKDDCGRLCYYARGVHMLTQYGTGHNMRTKQPTIAYEKIMK
jgi:DNA mismatch repair ATPase MutS